MQRILDPAQIEAFAQRTIPRLRLAERSNVFSSRAQRLRQLSGTQSVGHTIGDYLRLMGDVADAQQAALASYQATLPDAERISQARTHRMPLIHTGGWPRERDWRRLLDGVCESVVALPSVPAGVRAACGRLLALPSEQLEAQADAVLAAQTAGVECRKDAGVLDEIPGAYKNIDEVLANEADLVRIVHTLKQVLCVKG